MKQVKWLVWGIVCLVVGAFYEFVPRAAIKSIWPLLLFDFTIGSKRIRHNDLILFATILLIIGIVFLYKWIKVRKE